MERYRIEITGKTPLLLHADDVEWSDTMESWKNDPANKKMSRAGDDRTPAWRWVGYAYHDGEHLCLPAENIMRAMMEGGGMVLVPGGKSGKTFKAQTQSGMMSVTPSWLLSGEKGPIKVKDVTALMQNDKFSEHRPAVNKLGFDLLVRRARIGMSKHIRVRPILRQWSATGELIVTDEQITEEVLNSILAYAGTYKGLCDWRPGSKTPGSFGTFGAKVTRI